MNIETRDVYRSRIVAHPRCVDEYANIIGFYAGGRLDDALRRTRWVVKEYDLEGFADLVLIEASIRQSMSPEHPEHRSMPNTDQLKAMFAGRGDIGSMRKTLINRGYALGEHIDVEAGQYLWGSQVFPGGVRTTTRLPVGANNLPDVVVEHIWETFTLPLTISTPNSAVGAWALSRVEVGEYDEAASVLANAPSNANTLAAEMALYHRTQRWTDLARVAGAGRNATPGELGLSDTSPERATTTANYTREVAALLSGMADLSLGRPTVARAALSTATHSQLAPVRGWANYLLGMSWRGENDAEAVRFLTEAGAQYHAAEFDVALRDTDHTWRTTTPELIDRRTDKWDVTTEPDPEMERLREVEAKRETYAARAEALLDKQIGMDNVKREVRKMVTHIRITQERIRRGANPRAANYNLVLTGPPGTGKSTIVDVLTLHLAGLGIVDDPEPKVTHREDYVADIIGGSAIKTKKTIEDAVGKVLFIDEAYALVQQADGPNSDQFGKEALDTIVAESETRIGELVIVMAGYAADIDRLIRVNEGLGSRFPRRIDFSTYTLPEIADIAQVQAARMDMRLADDAHSFIADEQGVSQRRLLAHDSAGTLILDSLGNGRFARNLIESAVEHQALRLASGDTDLTELTEEALFTLTRDDVAAALDEIVTQKIG